MEFGILGPLLVRDETGDRLVSAPKQRVVLAALLLRPGQVVPMDTLAETLWDGHPPRSAVASMRNYIMRLRSGLGPAGERISSRSGGYLVEVGENELDSLRFARLRDQGAAAAQEGSFERAAATLGAALALWRGPALADVPSDTLQRDECQRLAESRLDALELKLDAECRLGRYGPAVTELQGLTAAHPERERLWALLMTALYHNGRQSDALAAYRRIRAILADEIGVEPGAELQAVHQWILAADRFPDQRPPGRPAPTRPGPPTHPQHPQYPQHAQHLHRVIQRPDHVPAALWQALAPFQVPAGPGDFTGRTAEVNDLVARLGGSPGSAPERISEPASRTAAASTMVLTGQAGIGKSALAAHVAHTVRSAFPGGALFVDLHGTDKAPKCPGDVLTSFLRALGVESGAIPTGLDDKAALYRSFLADRRVLIVLDDARSTAQVGPLLPGTASSAVVITSRHRLIDLAGAHRVDLDPLSPHEAAHLLGRIAGTGRTRAEPLAMAEVTAACGGLPLAVRIAAGRLAARPAWTVRHLADRLADGARLLDELRIGGLDVRAGLALGHDALDPASARAFRLLALLDMPAVSLEIAAALLDLPPAHAERLLEDLVDLHLLRSDQPACYGFDELTRVFAVEQALALECEKERARALYRATQAMTARQVLVPPLAYTNTVVQRSALRFEFDRQFSAAASAAAAG